MRKLVVVSITLLLIGVAAVAYASIPDSSGIIHGCYKTNNPAQGAVIAIDSAATCPSGYAALNWTGDSGMRGRQTVKDVRTILGGTSEADWHVGVQCPAGKKIVGGGGQHTSLYSSPMYLTRSQPNLIEDTGEWEGWAISYHRDGPADPSSFTIITYAICVIG